MNSLSHRIYFALEGAWRRRYLIAVPIVLLPILGMLAGIIAPKQYKTHTTMLIQETAKMNPFLEDLAVSAMLKDRLSALDTLLHSRFILKGVAKARGMITDETEEEKQDFVIATLSDSLVMTMPGKDLIRIDYRGSNAEGMRETLEAIATHFVEQLMAPERSSMKDSATFLAEHLRLRRKELESAEAALADFRSSHAAELPELHSSRVGRLTDLKQRLAEREASLAGATKALGGIDEQLSKTNPVVGRIEEQIVRIRGELALLLARYTEQHSSVQAAMRTLRRLEEERQRVISAGTGNDINSDQLWSIASNATLSTEESRQPLLISQLEALQRARGEKDALSEEVTSLRNTINDLQNQVARLGKQEQEMAKLERDLKVKRKMYQDLLERYEMARLTGSLGLFEREKRIKLIDRPFTPTAPSNLPTIIFIIAGLFGGIFLGAGLAVVAELTDSTLRRRDQVELLTEAPVITRLPAPKVTGS